MDNQQTQTNVALPEVMFFPAKNTQGKFLGGGFIKAGGIQARFAVYTNEKFSQGFSISFPIKKGNNGEVIREVEFINRDVEQHVYNTVASKLGNTGQGQARQQGYGNGYQNAPQQQFQQQFAPHQSAPQQPVVEEPRTISGGDAPVAAGKGEGHGLW